MLREFLPKELDHKVLYDLLTFSPPDPPSRLPSLLPFYPTIFEVHSILNSSKFFVFLFTKCKASNQNTTRQIYRLSMTWAWQVAYPGQARRRTFQFKWLLGFVQNNWSGPGFFYVCRLFWMWCLEKKHMRTLGGITWFSRIDHSAKITSFILLLCFHDSKTAVVFFPYRRGSSCLVYECHALAMPRSQHEISNEKQTIINKKKKFAIT